MSLIGNISDFFIKIIMLFTTLVALIHFAGEYPKYAFTFSLFALVLLISMLVKGISNFVESKRR